MIAGIIFGAVAVGLLALAWYYQHRDRRNN